MLDQNQSKYAHTDEQGRLILPPDVAASYGIRPNSRFLIEKESKAIQILRPVTRLNKLYIEVTNQCNLDCRTCVRHAWTESMGKMSDLVFTRIIEGLPAFKPLPSVFFGGFGEPLLHPRIIEMITRLKNLGVPVELITNGTLLTQEMSRKLVEAGLDTLWVSIDGAKPESYTDVRLGAALPDVLRNIEQLNRVRYSYECRSALRLGIAFVAMKRNIADLPEVAQIARHLRAHYLMVTNVLPYTPEMLDDVLYYNALNDSYDKQPVMNQFLGDPLNHESMCGEFPQPILSVNLPRMDISDITRGPYMSLMQPGINLNLGGASSQNTNSRWPFIENGSGVIGWQGGLSPCLPLMHGYSMYLNNQHRHSEPWVIGDIKNQSLCDLWFTPEHIAFREKVQAFDFSPCTLCGGCELLESNEKDCFGNEFPTCGGCLWAQGFIRCP